jgi:hypothetical protein
MDKNIQINMKKYNEFINEEAISAPVAEDNVDELLNKISTFIKNNLFSKRSVNFVKCSLDELIKKKNSIENRNDNKYHEYKNQINNEIVRKLQNENNESLLANYKKYSNNKNISQIIIKILTNRFKQLGSEELEKLLQIPNYKSFEKIIQKIINDKKSKYSHEENKKF